MDDLPVWRDKREPSADDPEWLRDARNPDSKEPLWVCDDERQMQLAAQCVMHGFDLPDFDIWLTDIAPGPMKTGLLNRRALAVDALLTNRHDAAQRHLEFMLEKSSRYEEERFLFPLAKKEHKAKKQRESAGFSSGEQRTEERKTDWDKWQSEAVAIFEKNPNLSKTGVCERVAKKYGVTTRAVTKRVSDVGKPRKSKTKK